MERTYGINNKRQPTKLYSIFDLGYHITQRYLKNLYDHHLYTKSKVICLLQLFWAKVSNKEDNMDKLLRQLHGWW